MLSRVVKIFGNTAVRGLFGNGSIANVFEIPEKGVSRYLATSSFKLSVADQTEVLLQSNLSLVERPDPFEQMAESPLRLSDNLPADQEALHHYLL